MPEKNLDQLKLQICGIESLELFVRIRGARNKSRHCDAALEVVFQTDSEIV
jgi:hypothetical protein